MFACVSTTPFGREVVPDVKMISAGSSALSGRTSSSSAAASARSREKSCRTRRARGRRALRRPRPCRRACAPPARPWGNTGRCRARRGTGRSSAQPPRTRGLGTLEHERGFLHQVLLVRGHHMTAPIFANPNRQYHELGARAQLHGHALASHATPIERNTLAARSISSLNARYVYVTVEPVRSRKRRNSRSRHRSPRGRPTGCAPFRFPRCRSIVSPFPSVTSGNPHVMPPSRAPPARAASCDARRVLPAAHPTWRPEAIPGRGTCHDLHDAGRASSSICSCV